MFYSYFKSPIGLVQIGGTASEVTSLDFVERTPRKISFSFSFQARTFEASTLDVSENGVGIQLLSGPPVSKGDVLHLPIGDPPVDAKIMWVRELSDKSLVGLQRIC